MKQEERKLKEQDLHELKTYQKRIKEKHKLTIVNKKLQADEVKQQEGVLRDKFIQRVL